jgi:hypothetical protein
MLFGEPSFPKVGESCPVAFPVSPEDVPQAMSQPFVEFMSQFLHIRVAVIIEPPPDSRVKRFGNELGQVLSSTSLIQLFNGFFYACHALRGNPKTSATFLVIKGVTKKFALYGAIHLAFLLIDL